MVTFYVHLVTKGHRAFRDVFLDTGIASGKHLVKFVIKIGEIFKMPILIPGKLLHL